MPHSDNPFLPDEASSPPDNPFLPDPEEEEEDEEPGILSRFFNALKGDSDPQAPSSEQLRMGFTERPEPIESGEAEPAAEAVERSFRAMASGPPATAEAMGKGLGLLDEETDVPMSEVPEGFELAGGVSRAGSEIGALLGGGKLVGTVLSRLGAPAKIAEGGGLLGDVARFGPLDALFAQNPETSGAVALSELAGEEDLTEALKGSRALRTGAEVGMGATPVAAFELLRNTPRGLRGLREAAERVRSTDEAARPGLEVNVKPGESGVKTGKPLTPEIENAKTGERFEATLWRGANPSKPLGSLSPGDAVYFAERPAKSIGFTAEARRVVDDEVQKFASEFGIEDEKVLNHLKKRVLSDRPSISSQIILEDRLGPAFRDIMEEFDARVTRRFPFHTATSRGSRELFRANVELDNPFVLDESTAEEAAERARQFMFNDERLFESLRERHIPMAGQDLEHGGAPLEIAAAIRTDIDLRGNLARDILEGLEQGRSRNEIVDRMSSTMRENDRVFSELQEMGLAQSTDETSRLAEAVYDKLSQHHRRLSGLFDEDKMVEQIRKGGISGSEGTASDILLEALRDQGFSGVVSRLGDTFDKSRGFSGAEVAVFDAENNVRALVNDEAEQALKEFVERVRGGERVTNEELAEAGFTRQDLLAAIARTGAGGALGGAVGGVLGDEEGAVAGAAIGAGAGLVDTKRMVKVAEDVRSLFRRGGDEAAEEADEFVRMTDNLAEEDDRYIQRLLSQDEMPDPPKDDPIEVSVRNNTPKDLDVNEVVERSVRRVENLEPRTAKEDYKRAKRLVEEGRLDERQLDINRTIANIMGQDPRAVASASPEISVEQQLSQALIYGTARDEWERLSALMGRLGNQISDAQYQQLVDHLDRLDQIMDESLTKVLNIESEFGRGLRLAQAKWRTMGKTPDQMLSWEMLAQRRAGGAFTSEDRARLMRILKGEQPVDEMAKSDAVKSFLARSVVGSVGGAGVGQIVGGEEGAGIGALAGLGLGAATGLRSPARLRKMLNAMPEEDLKSLQLSRFMQEMEGRQRGWGEAYVDLVRAGLLSAVKTDVVNIGSTLSHMTARRVQNPVAAFADRALKKAQDVAIARRIGREGTTAEDLANFRATGTVGAERTTALKLPEVKGGFATIDDEGRVVIQQGRLRNAIEDARKVWRGGEAQDVLRKMDFSGFRTGNAYIDGVFDYGFRRLGAEDRAMKGLAFYTALRERARAIALTEGLSGSALKGRVKELLAKPPDDMVMKSFHDAEVATFTNQTSVGSAVTSFKQNMRQSGAFGAMAAEFGVPFVNTLVNVADSFLKFSPLGPARSVVRGEAKEFVRALAQGNKMSPEAQRRLAEQVGAFVVGSAPFAMGAYLYSQGLMTGAWPKDSDANVMAQGNFQPYALKVGDHTVSMENISPVGNSIALGAHTASVFEDPDIRGVDQLTASTAGAFTQLGELSFLASATTMLEGITQPERATKALDNLGRMHVPTILRQASVSAIPLGVGDPTFRDEGGPGGVGSVPGVGAALKSLPGMGDKFEPQIDRLGQERVRKPASFFEAAGNPFRIEKINQNPVIKELTRLGVGIPDLSTPDRRQVERVEELAESALSKEQAEALVEKMQDPKHITKLRKIYGRILADQLESIMRSPRYQHQMTDAQRSELLDKHISRTRSNTTEWLVSEGDLPPSPDPTENVTPIFERSGSENNPFLPGSGVTPGGGDSVESPDTGGNPFLP